MRTMLFVSSLFAASLVTGAALADNNHPIEFGRAHGDTFEKTYKVSRTEFGARQRRCGAHRGQRPLRGPTEAERAS